jgi:hypothetical protein
MQFHSVEAFFMYRDAVRRRSLFVCIINEQPIEPRPWPIRLPTSW